MMAESQWKIVLIDDEQDIREVMTLTLEDAGYQVYAAPSGDEGLPLCKEVSPQIVITDVRMPGISGIEVLESVKRLYPDIEVIVCTAFGEMEMAIEALQLDASDFITKPVNDEALHLALARAKDRYIARKKVKDYTAFLEIEKTQTAEELKKTYSFQKNLLENSMDGILGCDNEEKIVIFNKSMEHLLGYSKNQVIQKMRFHQFFPPEEEKRFKQELLGDKYGGPNRLFRFETTLTDQTGNTIPTQVSASILFDGEQRTGCVCFFRDLREIHRLEREVQDQARILHQDKMISLGKLAASVVHEINNPLSGILNYLRLMNRMSSRGPITGETQEKFQRYLKLVEEETSRCSNIVSNLLTFSRKSPPAFETVLLEDIIVKSSVLSQHKLELSHISLKTDIAPNLPPLKGDFNQLQQCIINLIFNAIDAMPQGGTLTLSASHDEAEKTVNITVKDTGEGIREADLPHIFEPFFTTKQQGYGVGLGLSTVYGIIEHHKGTITVESRPGKGACFKIQLPVP